MRIVSVNVALPREVTYRGRRYATGIFKEPAPGKVALTRLNFQGDGQGSPGIHGGPDMAVYAYPHEHYPHWQADCATGPLTPGAFGENLTTEGLLEDDLAIGDVFRVGGTRLQVSEPRTPCHKLAMKFADDDLPRRFAESGHVGFYFRVLEEGAIGAGDEIVSESRDPARLTIAEVLALWADASAPAEALDRALAVDALSASWRKKFEKRRTRAASAKAAPGRKLQWDAATLRWA